MPRRTLLGALLVSLLVLSVDGASIALGSGHSCALLTNSAVMCWGWNYYGQLGDYRCATTTTTISTERHRCATTTTTRTTISSTTTTEPTTTTTEPTTCSFGNTISTTTSTVTTTPTKIVSFG